MKEWLDAWLGEAANLSAVLGFSALGVLAASRAIVLFGWRTFRTRRDRSALQESYDLWLTLATQDGAYAPTGLKTLAKTLSAVRTELGTLVRASFGDWADEKLNQKASGSTRLTYEQLFSLPFLLLPIRFVREADNEAITLIDLADLCDRPEPSVPEQPHRLNRRLLLIGSAGAGKTLTCLGVARHLSRRTGAPRWTLILNADDFEVDTSRSVVVGSLHWCADIVAKRLALMHLSDLRRKLLGEEIETNAAIVLDGLDEISQRLGRRRTDDLLNSWVFARARIVTTRASFYYSSLLGHRAIQSVDKAFAEIPPPGALDNFIHSACRVAFGEGGSRREDAIRNLRTRFPNIASVTQSPLLLMMLIDLDGVEDWRGTQVDTARIYEEFVEQTIAIDLRRLGNIASVRSLPLIYRRVAWIMCQEGEPHGRVSTGVARGVVAKAAAGILVASSDHDREQLEEVVATSSLISAAHGGSNRRAATKVRFRHESFRDFLVAQRLQLWMLGETEEGEDFFQWVDSPEVSHFVKEYLNRIRADQLETDRVSMRLRRHLERLLEERTKTTEESAARRSTFAAGQVAYYLGMIARGEARDRLVGIARGESDFWIRRAAAIGLGFGGWPECIDVLIDEMRSALGRGEFSLARKNIAIELGFYGDQDFDPSDPTQDRAGQSCQRLVTSVCAELGLDVEAPNWRMRLFNLIYLAKYREVSRASFEGTLRECAEALKGAIPQLETESLKKHYPEVAEIREVFTDVVGS